MSPHLLVTIMTFLTMSNNPLKKGDYLMRSRWSVLLSFMVVFITLNAHADSTLTRDLQIWCKNSTIPGDTCEVHSRVVEVYGDAAGCIVNRQLIHIYKPKWGHQWFFEGENSCEREVTVAVSWLRDSGAHAGQEDTYTEFLSPRKGWARIGHFGFNKGPKSAYRVMAKYSKH